MASNQSQGQDQGAEKNAYYAFWLLILIAMICGIIWYFLQDQLKWFFLAVRLVEFHLLVFFLGLVPHQIPFLGDWVIEPLAIATSNLQFVQQLETVDLSLDLAQALSVNAGVYLRYPIACYLLVLSWLVYRWNVHLSLRKKFDMRSLAAQEQINWPQIKVVTKVDLVKADIDSGPWAMNMTPLQFAKKNKLVSVGLVDAGEKRFAKIQAPEHTLVLNKVRAERAFIAQLGRPFQGVMQMPPHRRAIFAAFASRGARDTQVSNAFIDQLADSAASGDLDLTGIDEACAQYAQSNRIKTIIQSHAYEFTFFISLLLFAREDGVLASADFLWVKPRDRRLWYVINNVGRQTPSVEVGGIFNHWYYEVSLKRALSAPRVDGAVEALAVALSEVIYMPDDAERAEIIQAAATAKASDGAPQ